MKKLLTLALAAIMCAGSAKALDYVPEPGFTFQGFFGMNISNFRYTDSAADCLTDPKAGFNIGVRGEYMLPSCYGVFVNLGVGYTMKGAKLDDVVGLEGRDVTVKYRPYYIEIPLHVGYRYNVLENLGVYADFGPYFAIGTNGKFRTKFDDFSDDVTESIFKKEDGMRSYKRFDCGLGFRVGAEYAKHYNFILGFDWGLTDMYTQDMKHYLHQEGATDAACKNFCASLTFGYRF